MRLKPANRDGKPSTIPQSTSLSRSCRSALPAPSSAAERCAALIRFVRERSSAANSTAATSGRSNACTATIAPPRKSSPEGVRPGPRPTRSLTCSGTGTHSSAKHRSNQRDSRPIGSRAAAAKGPLLGSDTAKPPNPWLATSRTANLVNDRDPVSKVSVVQSRASGGYQTATLPVFGAYRIPVRSADGVAQGTISGPSGNPGAPRQIISAPTSR